MTDATDSEDESVSVSECPFPECDWSREYDPNDEYGRAMTEASAEHHYEREHAGRVRVQVTLEKEQLLGGRATEDIRKRLSDEMDGVKGYSLAYVRTEVLEEPDDHSKAEVVGDE